MPDAQIYSDFPKNSWYVHYKAFKSSVMNINKDYNKILPKMSGECCEKH